MRKREFEKINRYPHEIGTLERKCPVNSEWLSCRGCVKLRVMKKQASDQSFHDRRYQERKRAEAAKKVAPKKVVRESGREGGTAGASSGK
jgi:hypothetical protein